ncbi:3-deoxy-7-phosphoheptulonate synthase [Candidatus Parcubacteria bacterium]|nr:3-deoxy-7-phosphoheptulonate synthase [Candidatus Parcubacteria bacterium]
MKQRILTDSRVENILPLSSPNQIIGEIPQSEQSAQTVIEGRDAIKEIIYGNSKRLLVIVGPCSIHDEQAALEYAQWLSAQKTKYAGELELVMRTYLEKPRTTIGWKGIINDPHLDDSFDMETGLRLSRRLLHKITEIGVPVSTELLDLRTPQYTADLVSWGAIGARTIESQLHRELASGVSFPIGFKNGTSGDIQTAIDAMGSAETKHSFIGIDMDGQTAVIKTKGNRDTHLILRGGKNKPNYDNASVASAVEMLNTAGQKPRVMIDCSHGNSGKDYKKQPDVAQNIAEQIKNGNSNICGVMIESNLVEGNQKMGGKLVYGQSITDACAGLDSSEQMLQILVNSIKSRR